MSDECTPKVETKKQKFTHVETELVGLQQQTLDAVSQLVTIQCEMLEVKKAKLELKRQMMVMKKVKMATKGWFENESGVWTQHVGKE